MPSSLSGATGAQKNPAQEQSNIPMAPPVQHFHKWLAGEPFESNRNNIPDHLNKHDETMILDPDMDKSHTSFLSDENDMPQISESRIENQGGEMSDADAMAVALAAQREKNKAK